MIRPVTFWLRKWTAELLLQIAVLTVFWAMAPWLVNEILSWNPEAPDWPALAPLAPWILISLLSFPLLFSIAGKVLVVALIGAEMTVPAEPEPEHAFERRRKRASRIAIVALGGFFAWMVILDLLLWPPWYVPALLLLGFVRAGRRVMRKLREFYALCHRSPWE